MKNKKFYSALRLIPVFAVVIFFSVSSLIPSLRPNYSDTEKRELSKKPDLDKDTIMSGEYFTAYDLWFSDTFPYREFLINGNLKLKKLFGIQHTYIHGDIEPGDEIPEVPERTPAGDTLKPQTPATQTPITSTPSPTPFKPQTEAPPKTDDPGSENPGTDATQSLGAILLVGDSAYEYYSFNKLRSEKYADMVSEYAKKLDGYASVYNIIIPNSMGIMPSDSVLSGINTSDQGKAINYIFSIMSDKVKKVYIYDALKSRRDEYLYFRTDHHWTALGAYYAYREFSAVKGITPNELSSFEKMEFTGFLGTFYTQAGKPKAMENNPDTVYAYIPKGTNQMKFTDKQGNITDWKIITNVTTWKQNAKYNTFIGGDNPFSVIENPNVKNGESCLVVKESYGNALVPFLVDHYEKVYVVDYRYYKNSITEFVKSNNVTDVIFANNITVTRNETSIGLMKDLL